jgi:hypothetical protein
MTTISIPGQPDVQIENGIVVNAKALRIYWRERHHNLYRLQALQRSMKEPEPEAPDPPRVSHVVMYEHSDLTDKNLQRIGQLEMEVRQLKEVKTLKESNQRNNHIYYIDTIKEETPSETSIPRVPDMS